MKTSVLFRPLLRLCTEKLRNTYNRVLVYILSYTADGLDRLDGWMDGERILVLCGTPLLPPLYCTPPAVLGLRNSHVGVPSYLFVREPLHSVSRAKYLHPSLISDSDIGRGYPRTRKLTFALIFLPLNPLGVPEVVDVVSKGFFR